MTRPDLVILVDTPPDLARHRLEREPRGHGRLLGLIAEDPAWMDRASARLQTIWALCRRHPEVETFHLTPADLDAPALVGLIKRRCHPAGEERRRA